MNTERVIKFNRDPAHFACRGAEMDAYRRGFSEGKSATLWVWTVPLTVAGFLLGLMFNYWVVG